jgi:hypothetical protein
MPEKKAVELKTEQPVTAEKVAIVGFAPGSRGKAPFKDTSFQIWGVNEVYKVVPRVDVLFELHSRNMIKDKGGDNHIEWLKAAPIPVFMQEHYRDFPTSIAYPKDRIVARFGRYFTNTISWMIALAIDVGVKELHIYGVDMAADEEYSVQKPSVEYFIGLARGMGIDVYLPPQCDLAKAFFLYGFEDVAQHEMELKMKARQQELQSRVNQHQANIERETAAAHQLAGALDDCRYWNRTWLHDSKNLEGSYDQT